jgi:Uncharacterised BCR, YnfA/UPF0060 family
MRQLHALKTEWRWRREGTPAIVGVMGAIILVAYGVIPTLQKNGNFGRIYVAYGGVFIVASLLWGWGIDGTAEPVRLGRRRGGGCRGQRRWNGRHESPLPDTDSAEVAGSNIPPNIVLGIESTGFVEDLVRATSRGRGR